jgi:Alr-MurF fusion protein
MISLYDILEASNGQLFGEPAAHIFTDFCFDSRYADEAQLFVTLKTDRGDTHQFIREAVEKGVLGVICTRPPDFDTDGVTVVIVRDTEAALMAWSHFVLGKLGTKVIAVTGSSGKSGAVEAISRVLGTRYTVHSGTLERSGPLSVPLSLAKLTAEHKFLVLELGTTQPGEMAQMVQASKPEVAVVTQIGHAHIDRFADIDQIIQEKSVLVHYLSPNGLAVLNYDDDYVLEMASDIRAPVVTVGLERFGADMMAYNVVVGLTKTGFDVRHGSERYVGRWTPWLGKHLLYSILSALAVGLHYSVPIDDALMAVTDLPPMPGRMNVLPGLHNALLIDDTHSANPESTLAALNWLQAVSEEGNRVFFVMGDMDNLGDYSQQGHRAVGQRAAEFASLIVTAGTEAALIGRAALDQGMERRQVRMTYNVQDAVAALKNEYALSESDIILVKGGAAAQMELVVQELLRDEQDRVLLSRQDESWEAINLVQPTHPSWVELDMGALANNVREVKNMIGDNVVLMAVVKADAYGHGAAAVSRTALLNGAEYLAVASMNEALELRNAGIEAPILVLSYTPTYFVRQAVRLNIAVTLYDLDLARAYDRIARETDGKLRIHLKIDTGMGRLGVLPEDAMPFFRHMINLSHVEIEGLYTHFSVAGEDAEYTAEQVKAFKGVIKPLRASGFDFKYIHAANSAGMLASKDNHFTMVRVGLAMYGLSPSEDVPVPPEFQPVLTWKTVIAQVRTLPPGHAVGYGNTYQTRGEETIAVIPVGYADGFRRSPENWGNVLVHGQFVPVVGRVSMDKSTINVSNIPGVAVGDEVVLLGRQGDREITADDIARRLGTINYEVVTTILPRAPRH